MPAYFGDVSVLIGENANTDMLNAGPGCFCASRPLAQPFISVSPATT